MTADISRMILAGQKEIFTKNFDPYPVEYTQFSTPKTSTKQTETYDSMGNLASGGEKQEGGPISYGKVQQAYQTEVKNKTWANGYEITLEATKYDLYGVTKSVKAKELARTMRELEEQRVIKRYDEALTTNLADGVPLASNSKPLANASGLTNDTLATASTLTDPANHKSMIKMFANFMNHQGGKMKSYPNLGMTNIQNQLDIEEIYGSDNVAGEISNTKNVIKGKIRWVYSTYLASTTAWMMIDTKYEHVIMQRFMDTVFDADEDKISTKNMYLNAIAIYETGTLPNIGIVYNEGA